MFGITHPHVLGTISKTSFHPIATSFPKQAETSCWRRSLSRNVVRWLKGGLRVPNYVMMTCQLSSGAANPECVFKGQQGQFLMIEEEGANKLHLTQKPSRLESTASPY